MKAAIEGVRVAGTTDGPATIVLLAPEDEADVLPIFIGIEEGISIARGLDAKGIGRPLTHDLLLDVMEELGGRVERVVISDLEENTYIATLHVRTPRDSVAVDARPSDSLALAARTNCPIEIAESVFEAGRRPHEEFADVDDIWEVVAA